VEYQAYIDEIEGRRVTGLSRPVEPQKIAIAAAEVAAPIRPTIKEEESQWQG
jgi:hypothetical protein